MSVSGIQIRNLPLSQYIEWLREQKFFYFPRYGDGEWRAIFETTGNVACGFQQLSPALQRDMERGLLDNVTSPILWGMQDYALGRMGKRIAEFLQRENLCDLSWVNADVFHYASRDGRLFPLVEELKQHKLIMVGPSFLNKLMDKIFPSLKLIAIPLNNCYEEQNMIQEQILLARDKFGDGLVFGFSAGPVANILITSLWRQMPNNFLIDFGSLWDVFCGRRSRKYMSQSSYPETKLQKNLGLH